MVVAEFRKFFGKYFTYFIVHIKLFSVNLSNIDVAIFA